MNLWARSAILILAAWCAPAALELPAGSALRVVVVMGGMLVFPGLPLALRLPSERHAGRGVPGRTAQHMAVLTGAVSVSSALLVAMTLTLTGALTAQRALVIVAVVSTVATLAPPWRRAGHSGPGDG